MAKLSCRSSVASVSSSGSPVPLSVSYDEFLDSLFSSFAASLNGLNPTKEGWRRFLLLSNHRDILSRHYLDHLLLDCADRTFNRLGRRLSRSQSVPTQMVLDSTVIHLPPLIVAADSPRKGHKLYSTLRDATLGNFRYHIDFLTKKLESQRLHLESLETAYAAFFATVRGDMSARLRDIVGLFARKG